MEGQPLTMRADRVALRAKAAALVVVAIVVGLIVCAPAASADQCSPPGVQSASSLPTNLAKAAKGPAEDKYTTPTVEPLKSVNINALGLGKPGTQIGRAHV